MIPLRCPSEILAGNIFWGRKFRSLRGARFYDEIAAVRGAVYVPETVAGKQLHSLRLHSQLELRPGQMVDHQARTVNLTSSGMEVTELLRQGLHSCWPPPSRIQQRDSLSRRLTSRWGSR